MKQCSVLCQKQTKFRKNFRRKPCICYACSMINYACNLLFLKTNINSLRYGIDTLIILLTAWIKEDYIARCLFAKMSSSIFFSFVLPSLLTPLFCFTPRTPYLSHTSRYQSSTQLRYEVQNTLPLEFIYSCAQLTSTRKYTQKWHFTFVFHIWNISLK